VTRPPTVRGVTHAHLLAQRRAARVGEQIRLATQLIAGIKTVHPLDEPAKVLAGLNGEPDWGALPEATRRLYRLKAAAMITAADSEPRI
jgi:hypothetical protein